MRGLKPVFKHTMGRVWERKFISQMIVCAAFGIMVTARKTPTFFSVWTIVEYLAFNASMPPILVMRSKIKVFPIIIQAPVVKVGLCEPVLYRLSLPGF